MSLVEGLRLAMGELETGAALDGRPPHPNPASCTCARCIAWCGGGLPKTEPHLAGKFRGAVTGPPVTGFSEAEVAGLRFVAESAPQGATGIDPLPSPHPIVDVRLAPQPTPCGHLIRDGQTTIGACELERGHEGEHQRAPIGSDFRSSRLER